MDVKKFLIINLALVFTLISFHSSASNIEDSDWYSVYKNEFGELKSRYNYPNHFTFHNNGKSLMIVQNINDISIRFLDDSSSRKIFFNTEIVRDQSQPIYNPDPLPPGGGMPLTMGSYSQKTIEYGLHIQNKPKWNISSSNRALYENLISFFEASEGEIQIPETTPIRQVDIFSSPSGFTISNFSDSGVCDAERAQTAIGYHGYTNVYLCSGTEFFTSMATTFATITVCFGPQGAVGCAPAISGLTATLFMLDKQVKSCNADYAAKSKALDNCLSANGINNEKKVTSNEDGNPGAGSVGSFSRPGGGYKMTCTSYTTAMTSGIPQYTFCSNYRVDYI